MWNYCLAIPMNAKTLCMKCFRCVNNVSRLCLHLSDTALEFNLPFDICRWLVEGEDVEIVHDVLVRHHRLLTSRPLLWLLLLHRLVQQAAMEEWMTYEASKIWVLVLRGRKIHLLPTKERNIRLLFRTDLNDRAKVIRTKARMRHLVR